MSGSPSVGVTADRLSKRYAATRAGAAVAAVDDVSLTVEPGAFVSLLGPSGCGKTTLLRLVGGFESPDSGTITMGGQDVTRLPPQKRPTAMVFQSYALFPTMTVGENVAYGSPTGTSVVDDGWMNSEGHRANILNPDYTLEAIGARKGPDGRWYVAQVFGRRA